MLTICCCCCVVVVSFRQWEDIYAKSIISDSDYDSDCFMVYLYPRRTMHINFGDPYMIIHKCDASLSDSVTKRIDGRLNVDRRAEKLARREELRKQIL